MQGSPSVLTNQTTSNLQSRVCTVNRPSSDTGVPMGHRRSEHDVGLETPDTHLCHKNCVSLGPVGQTHIRSPWLLSCGDRSPCSRLQDPPTTCARNRFKDPAFIPRALSWSPAWCSPQSLKPPPTLWSRLTGVAVPQVHCGVTSRAASWMLTASADCGTHASQGCSHTSLRSLESVAQRVSIKSQPWCQRPQFEGTGHRSSSMLSGTTWDRRRPAPRKSHTRRSIHRR